MLAQDKDFAKEKAREYRKVVRDITARYEQRIKELERTISPLEESQAGPLTQFERQYKEQEEVNTVLRSSSNSIKMDSGAINQLRATIQSCLLTIKQNCDVEFILVSGAGGILAGSQRMTSDIDILLPCNINLATLKQQLAQLNNFSTSAGVLYFQATGKDQTAVSIDMLSTLVGKAKFEDIRPFTFQSDSVQLMQLDIALSVKLHAFHLRADDGNGMAKKKTDMEDIKWVASRMVESEMTISNDCAAMFKMGHYQMLQIRLTLGSDIPAVNELIAVGVKKLLVPWEADTEEQKEYFTYFAPAGACPLTGELLEDEE